MDGRSPLCSSPRRLPPVFFSVSSSFAAPVWLPPLPRAADSASGNPAIVPVVVFGPEARQAPMAFAQSHKLDPAEVSRGHVASGLIQCGNAHGAGQLTLTDDVVTTAAHVFYDENGLPRARSCTFDLTINGLETRVPIDLSSVVAGSTNPYDVEVAHDWAVARLSHAVIGVKPYGLADSVRDIHDEAPVTFVARGHIDWGDAKDLSMQDCMMHKNISKGPEGTREFSFDCDTGDGASGGALMFDGERSRVGAILVGWRSNKPFKRCRSPHALQFRGHHRGRLPQCGLRRRRPGAGAESSGFRSDRRSASLPTVPLEQTKAMTRPQFGGIQNPLVVQRLQRRADPCCRLA